MAYNKSGYNIRAENIQRIVSEHYEPENMRKCYKQVWKQHVWPFYGIGYAAFLKYVKADVPVFKVKEKELTLPIWGDEQFSG